MELILTLIVVFFAILQIAMIIKFFCMCGDVKVMRVIAKRLLEGKTDALLTGFKRALLLGDNETAKKKLDEAYSRILFHLAENRMNSDNYNIDGIKAEYEELLHLANARLPGTLNNVHTLGDIRIMLKMEKGIETVPGSNIYGLR